MPEDATAANFAIYAGEECLTRNRPRRQRLGEPSDSVFGPVAGLADWFIENWPALLWETHHPFRKSRSEALDAILSDLPGETDGDDDWRVDVEGIDAHILSMEKADFGDSADWQHRHFLGHATSDLAIPSIMVLPEDRNIVLSVDRLPSTLQSSVEFIGPDGKERVRSIFVCNKTSFKATAEEFVRSTIERANTDPRFGRWASWLAERWRNAQEQEADPGLRLSLMLGELSAERVRQLQRDSPILASGLNQLLLDCKMVTERDELSFAESIVDEFALRHDSAIPHGDKTGWETVAMEPISGSVPEYAQGYQLARVIRRKLALTEKPIYDLQKTLKRLDVLIEDDLTSPLFRVAVCASHGKHAHVLPSSLGSQMRGVTSSALR